MYFICWGLQYHSPEIINKKTNKAEIIEKSSPNSIFFLKKYSLSETCLKFHCGINSRGQ